MSYEIALFEWEAGVRRLRQAPEERRATLERVIDALVEELRRRLDRERDPLVAGVIRANLDDLARRASQPF